MPKQTIVRKIQEMREQPEHVRVRYVLIGVTISMTFVVVLWIFAIQDNVRKLIDTGNPLADSPLLMQDEQQSLQDILQTTQDAFTVPTQPISPTNNAVEAEFAQPIDEIGKNEVENTDAIQR